jgi:hypothetical protein
VGLCWAAPNGLGPKINQTVGSDGRRHLTQSEIAVAAFAVTLKPRPRRGLETASFGHRTDRRSSIGDDATQTKPLEVLNRFGDLAMGSRLARAWQATAVVALSKLLKQITVRE